MTAEHIVLLAEDDVDDQEMLMEAMVEEDASLRFLVASTGSKALELLKNLPETTELSLIIVDYNLPEISGAEILERLRPIKRFEAVPKVVWSTSNSPVYNKKCIENGALSYLVKPTGIAGIREIAKEMLKLCATGCD